VEGLKDELGQVMLNLIKNAADAIAEIGQQRNTGWDVSDS